MSWSKKRPPRPTSADVARRFIILKQVVAYAVMTPPRGLLDAMTAKWSPDERRAAEREFQSKRDEFWNRLRDAGLWGDMSHCERELAKTTFLTMTVRQHIDASWRVESAHVIAWALDLVPELPPYDTRATTDFLKLIRPDVPAFFKSARLRPQDDINHARDVAELWHWRSRTRTLVERGEPLPTPLTGKLAGLGVRSYDDIVRLTATKAAENGDIAAPIDGDFPACGKAYRDLTPKEWSTVQSVTVERHFALNWLCGYAPDNDWDKTPTGT